MGYFGKIKTVLSNITIEPIFFLFSLSVGFYLIVSKNLYIEKVCKVNLNFTEEICDNIQNHTEEQNKVQQYVSSLQAYNGVIQALPVCIFSLFAGPWSDRHGRKLLIIWTTFGLVLYNVVFLINTAYFYELKAEYLMFECIQEMTGGGTVFFLACYSYIADVTSKESRTRRISYLNGVYPIGLYVGNAASGPIKKYLGFMYSFSISMLAGVLALAYCVIFVKDSRILRDRRVKQELLEEIEHLQQAGSMEEAKDKEQKLAEMNDGIQGAKKGFFQDFFNINNLKEGFGAILQKREGHRRAVLILLILAFELEILILHGKGRLLYLYLRKKLQWTIMEYSRYKSILGILMLVAQYIAVPFLSVKLKFQDYTISLIDNLTSFINLIIVAFVVNEWMLYVGGAIALLDYTSAGVFRSMISKLVHANEVGKVFSVVGIFQSLMPIIAGPLYGFLYKNTVSYQPAAFLFLIIAITSVVLVILLIITKLMRTIIREQKKNDESKK